MAVEPTLNSPSLGDSRSDSFIGRAVIDLGLTTAEEVQACVARQRKHREAGREVRLSELLIRHGCLTASQLKRIGSPSDDSGARPIQQIPGFQIMQKIGAGAMATVYKAKQLSLDRIVAIKVLPKRLSENTEFVERFYREGRAAAKLNHNNIVQAIDVGESAGYHYFVMEFVDGVTVYDEMVRSRVYSEKAAIEVIIQVCRALEHAHARGFIHRDVKPKNIMITRDGTAKLADMGLAREMGDATAAEQEAGRAYGTPYYISPEQIRGEKDVDFRTDIYSLGATFYHMVTGRVPFDGQTPAAVMHKHLKEPLKPPDHVNPALSTGLAEVIERMMAKTRDRRYRSTTDLLVDLERVLRGEPPLQARTRYDDGLLQDLADGAESEQSEPRFQGGSSMLAGGQPSRAPAIIILAAIIVVEFIIILALLLAR